MDREAAGQVSLPQFAWRSLKAMTTASSQIEGAAKALDSRAAAQRLLQLHMLGPSPLALLKHVRRRVWVIHVCQW